MITQSELKELLHYCPETGVFTWKISIHSRAKVGAIAGQENREDGYLSICVGGKAHMAHRLAFLYMKGSLPRELTDHIDHDRTNNRFSNLREVTQQENTKNKSMYRTKNTSGYNGVHWHKAANKWVANICVDGKQNRLGFFAKLEDAISVRKAANIVHGYHANHGKKNPAHE